MFYIYGTVNPGALQELMDLSVGQKFATRVKVFGFVEKKTLLEKALSLLTFYDVGMGTAKFFVDNGVPRINLCKDPVSDICQYLGDGATLREGFNKARTFMREPYESRKEALWQSRCIPPGMKIPNDVWEKIKLRAQETSSVAECFNI